MKKTILSATILLIVATACKSDKSGRVLGDVDNVTEDSSSLRDTALNADQSNMADTGSIIQDSSEPVEEKENKVLSLDVTTFFKRGDEVTAKTPSQISKSLESNGFTLESKKASKFLLDSGIDGSVPENVPATEYKFSDGNISVKFKDTGYWGVMDIVIDFEDDDLKDQFIDGLKKSGMKKYSGNHYDIKNYGTSVIIKGDKVTFDPLVPM